LVLRVFETPLNSGSEIGKPVQCASLCGLDSGEGSAAFCDVDREPDRTRESQKPVSHNSTLPVSMACIMAHHDRQ
jgi:hypothetical protein